MLGFLYCIQHEQFGFFGNEVSGESDCIWVTCPTPEMEEDWEKHVVSPTPQELHAMDLRATELVTSWA